MIECAEEIEPDMWITNSGYRAYPFLKWSLMDIPEVQTVELLASGLPADWPDHFEVRGEKIQPTIDIGALFDKLIPKIRRRI